MEFFEDMAIHKAELKPSLWLRYVDDTLVVWPHGRDHLDEFFRHLNSERSSIQFTMELENEGSIPFLDVLVKRGDEVSQHRSTGNLHTPTDMSTSSRAITTGSRLVS